MRVRERLAAARLLARFARCWPRGRGCWPEDGLLALTRCWRCNMSAVVPRHLELSRSQRVFSALSIVAALLLLGVCGVRIAGGVDLIQWWVLPVLVSGVAAADFGSGLIHWFADTWGRDDLPVIGRRLLVPFRLHHVNPDDLIDRPFVDCNGDVAFVTLPVLLGSLAVPLEAPWGGPAAVFLFALSGIGMMTNQIHQWAHLPSPPRAVRLLQQCGVFLGHAAHAEHHDRPYDANYCITTGWCNRPLEAIGFFRRLEAGITHLTGAQPRQDDRRYDAANAAAGALTRAAGPADGLPARGRAAGANALLSRLVGRAWDRHATRARRGMPRQ